MTTVVCHLRPSLRLALSVFAFAVVVTELHTVAALESTTGVAEVAVEECCAGRSGRNGDCKRIGIGDGDCQLDAECQHGLKCGEDNCGDFRDSDDFEKPSILMVAMVTNPYMWRSLRRRIFIEVFRN